MGAALPKSVARTKITANIRSSSFRKSDLLEIARFIDESVPTADFPYESFSVKGREFDVETRSAADLSKVDWPDSVKGVRFNKDQFGNEHDHREIEFRISKFVGWGGEIEVTGEDATWVKGVAAHLESLVKRRRSLNGLLNSFPVVLTFALLPAMLLIAALLLTLSAIDAPRDQGEWGRYVGTFGAIAILVICLGSAAFLIPYLFPSFELTSHLRLFT